MSIIAENLAAVRERIGAACSRAGRDPREVRLIGVTKTVPVDRIREGAEAGLTLLGENYIQEARKKIEAMQGLEVSWHFIGHLQSNKAKVAAELCDWVHTVDRTSLAEELNRQARRRNRVIPVLLQVNVGDETSKSGSNPRHCRISSGRHCLCRAFPSGDSWRFRLTMRTRRRSAPTSEC